MKIMDFSKFMKYDDFLGRLRRCFGRLWDALEGFGGTWEQQQIYSICDGLAGCVWDPEPVDNARLSPGLGGLRL